MTSKSLNLRIISFALVLTSFTLGFTLTVFAQSEENTDSLPPIGAGILDGRIYVGTTGIIGDTTSNSEEKILFQRGRFKSFAFESVGGFKEGDYKAEKKGKGYLFHVEITATAGRIVWDGTVTDDSLRATAVWYRPEMDSAMIWVDGWIQKPFDPLNKLLDGKTITGKYTAGDSVTIEEQLTFANGKFRSKDSEKYGFVEHEYYINPRFDTLYFTASVPGPNHTERRWKGWVFHQQMDAILEWDKANGEPIMFLTFKGKIAKKSKN